MSDTDAPILGVAAYEPPEDHGDLSPDLEQQTPPEEAGPIRLDRAGRHVIEQALRMEGELVRSLRHVPAEEPSAWRWTDAEIDALMPALEGLVERYGIAAQVNEHAPNAGAVLALSMHATRSLAAERAWRAAHPEHGEPDGLDHGPQPVAQPAPLDGPVREPAGAEPGADAGADGGGGALDPLLRPRVRGGL